MTAVLSDDERMLLRVLAAAAEPVGLREVMGELLPPMPDGPGWGGQQWWERQWCATAKNWMDLRRAGMFEPVPRQDGDNHAGGRYALTEAGRQALAGQEADRPRSSFWDDLNRRLGDPEFRQSYAETSLRIQEIDRQRNGDAP